jgi:hypothetical protein
MSTKQTSNTIDYGRGKAARIRRLVHGLLLAKDAAGEIPTNGRFIFYELIQRGDAVKPTRPGHRREKGWPPGEVDIAGGTKWLRDEKHVPWWWIADESRHLTTWAYADSVADFLRDRLAAATINPWGDEAPPLIICEAMATAGVLASAVSRYCCPITGTKGFCNAHLRNDLAPLFENEDRQVLYLGDLDRSGADVEGNAQRLLGVDIPWRRLAITEKQAAKIEPTWKVDKRDKKGREAWEVESLGQRQLVKIVTAALDKMLPEPLERVLEREDEQRADAEAVLEGLGA